MRILIALLLAILGLAAFAQVTVTKGDDGAFTAVTPNYTAKVGADGNLHSLVCDGTEFLCDGFKGVAGGGYVNIVEAREWSATTYTFAAVSVEGTTVTATADKHTLIYKFLPDAIELTFSHTADPTIWSLCVNQVGVTMYEQQSGEAIPMKTAWREGTPQLFNPRGANVTLPPGAFYFIAKNSAIKPETDPMVLQMWMPRTWAKDTLTRRIVVHAKPTAADALQSIIAVPTANHLFPGGAPAAMGFAAKLRFPEIAIDGTAELVVTDFLTKKEVFRQTQPLKLAALAEGKVLFNVAPAPGMYAAVLTAKQGAETLAVRSFPFAYDIAKIALPARPADFDKFWDDTLAEQEKIPADVQLELIKEENGCKLYKMTFTGLFNRKFHAWLSVPTKEGKYPASLQLPPSGINATYMPASGPNVVGMSLAIAGQEVEYPTLTSFKSDPYFKRGWDYFQTGIDTKETWYYRAVFAACSRAVDILAARPETDPTRIGIGGGSQGGGLSFITAALNPKVALAVCGSPGLFGLEWKLRYLPNTYWPPIDPVDEKFAFVTDEKVLEARIAVARYMDAANFAPRITGMVLINSGMSDPVTSQAAVYGAWSRLTNARVRAILADPWAGHNGPRNGQWLGSTWSAYLQQGTPEKVLDVKEAGSLPILIEKK
jgi:cephalosporin-C deacetylase